MRKQKNNSKPLNWSFAGCRTQGLIVLRALVAQGFKPNLIAILPESTRDEIKSFSRIAEKCQARFLIAKNLDAEVKHLKNCDLLLVCRFNLLPRKIFDAPKLGALNIHLGLLPDYRGVHPISWALVNGEKFAGLSIHSIDSGIDTGRILKQVKLEILNSDDIWSLTERLEIAAATQAVLLFKSIQKKYQLPVGKKPKKAGFYARRRLPDDGKIDWSKPSREIYNLVRALQSPLPLSFCFSAHGERVNILKCRLPSEMPGTVLAISKNGQYVIQSSDGVSIVESDKKLKIGEVLT